MKKLMRCGATPNPNSLWRPCEGKRTFRTLSVEVEEIEFSEGFTDLHTRSYEEILKGSGFGLREVKPSIDVVYKIRELSKSHI